MSLETTELSDHRGTPDLRLVPLAELEHDSLRKVVEAMLPGTGDDPSYAGTAGFNSYV